MKRRRSMGVTLMELLVVIVILGILAAIAYPSYRRQAVRANRTEAKVELQRVAQAFERCFTRIHAYDECDVDIGETPSGLYVISIDPDPEITATTYSIMATPQGGQAEDTCGVLTLSQDGTRGPATEGCW